MSITTKVDPMDKTSRTPAEEAQREYDLDNHIEMNREYLRRLDKALADLDDVFKLCKWVEDQRKRTIDYLKLLNDIKGDGNKR